MTSTRSPQLSIFLLPDGTPRAESIGRNGTRRKIDLDFDFASRNPEVMAELHSQRDEESAREQRALRDLQAANIHAVAAIHGRGVAQKVWHNGELVFARAWKRYLARNAFDSASANGKKSTKPTSAKRTDIAVTINMDEI